MAERRRLPDTRNSVTKKVVIKYPVGEGMAELDIYVTVGLYDDGAVGELFMKAGKMGGTVSGLLDAVGICMSIGLQCGVPLEWFTTKLKGMRFEPEGGTNDRDIRHASSMIDAVMRWMERRFLTPPEPVQLPPPQADMKGEPPPPVPEAELPQPPAPEPVPETPATTEVSATPEPGPGKKARKLTNPLLKMHRKRRPARNPT